MDLFSPYKWPGKWVTRVTTCNPTSRCYNPIYNWIRAHLLWILSFVAELTKCIWLQILIFSAWILEFFRSREQSHVPPNGKRISIFKHALGPSQQNLPQWMLEFKVYTLRILSRNTMISPRNEGCGFPGWDGFSVFTSQNVYVMWYNYVLYYPSLPKSPSHTL